MSVLAADRAGEANALRHRAIRKFSLLGFVMFIVIVVFSRLLNGLFHISENTIIIIASISFLYAFPLCVNQAVMSARQDFFALAFNNFLGAFSRLFFIILFVMVWPFGLNGAAWALGIAGLASLLLSFYQIKKLKLPTAPHSFHPRLRRFWRFSLMVLWFTVLTQFFYNFDMLFVKSFFSPVEAGLYGALLTAGRIIYFVGGAVPLVMFPVVANLKNDGDLRRHLVLAKSLALMAALAVPVYLVMYCWPGFVIRLIVGAKYLSIAPYLPGFGLVMLALTLVSVLSSYFLALGRRGGLVIMTGAVLLETILLSLFHRDLTQVIVSLGASFAAAAVGMLYLAFAEYRNAKRMMDAQAKIGFPLRRE
jgi:O-antigen/teichoic acid export membrane protein